MKEFNLLSLRQDFSHSVIAFSFLKPKKHSSRHLSLLQVMIIVHLFLNEDLEENNRGKKHNPSDNSFKINIYNSNYATSPISNFDMEEQILLYIKCQMTIFTK